MRPRYPRAIDREHVRLMLAHARRRHGLTLPRLREAVDAFGGELRRDGSIDPSQIYTFRGDVSPLLELLVGVVRRAAVAADALAPPVWCAARNVGGLLDRHLECRTLSVRARPNALEPTSFVY